MPGYLVSNVKAHFMATQNEKGKTIPVNNVTQTIFLLKSEYWDLAKNLKVLWREKSALFARQKRKKKKRDRLNQIYGHSTVVLNLLDLNGKTMWHWYLI